MLANPSKKGNSVLLFPFVDCFATLSTAEPLASQIVALCNLQFCNADF